MKNSVSEFLTMTNNFAHVRIVEHFGAIVGLYALFKQVLNCF